MKENIQWLLPVFACIVASVAAVFLPVLTCIYPNGLKVAFNLFSFTEQSQDFLGILASYKGPYEMYIDEIWLTILAALVVLAIIAAFIGVITMSLQRPNTLQFVLALVGICTAISAIIVIIAAPVSVISSQNLPVRYLSHHHTYCHSNVHDYSN